MTNRNYLSMQPRQSCIASFQTLYGIGKIKAAKLNCFLLNHPIQIEFAKHFNEVLYPTAGHDILVKIPLDSKIRLCVENHLRKKILVFCYQMFRLFQNLPTRGQRTRSNANSHYNQNPYKRLRVNLSFYQEYEVAYKKRELLHNARYEELKAFIKSREQHEKMRKEDQKERTRRTRQEFIKNQRK